nr:MAG TPA: hypothetical protein [Caudoviricetes sp.]
MLLMFFSPYLDNKFLKPVIPTIVYSSLILSYRTSVTNNPSKNPMVTLSE